MALSILDGNQTATTLATTVSGGAHFPNHIIASGTVTANVDVGSRIRILDANGDDILVDPIDGAVQAHVNNPVTIGSLPAISGTVTANGFDLTNSSPAPIPLTEGGTGVRVGFDLNNGFDFPVYGTVTVGNSVAIGSLPAISGTVTIGNTVTVSQAGSTTIGAMPSGALTTRFGSITTANTAQISTAVTNSSRKYLLIQNVTTASNAITVGIGFTPTTTQGIQLTAGAGITFESSYIPTGAVYVLSSVTASSFTILEA